MILVLYKMPMLKIFLWEEQLSTEKNNSPRFLVWAISDPLGAPLQRAQIIKGWLEDGEHREKVFEAC